MSRIFSSLLLLLLVWAGDDQTVPRTFRVLTYNIHHGEGTDGRVDLSRLAEVMRGVQPDIVALQEVDQGTERSGGVDQLAELGRLTDLHAAEFGKTMDYWGGRYGVAVLSRWPVSSTKNHPLPGSPDREPRTALTVQVEPAGERGPVLEFTSTHLDQGRDPENRLAQARSLNELLVRDEGQPTILAGDMNSRPDTEVMEIFEARWAVASAVDPSPTTPSGRPRSRVDHVLFRPVESWRVLESRVIDERLASDHRPVLVVLEWMGKRRP
ncbi:MAG TPA: endonuclease/exonuclease/phosphatase family protein [Vicinamibacterales bacterium]|nr:endonuclease/exonuclease/phosphatase family protein [Vicinamibacterales bacterium]